MKNEKYQEKSYRPIAFTLNKAYLKKFLKKDFFLLYSFIGQILMSGCPYFVRYWAICIL